MTKTTLTIAAIAAALISTSNSVQASFNDIADDRIFAEVGQDIVPLKGAPDKRDYRRTYRPSPHNSGPTITTWDKVNKGSRR